MKIILYLSLVVLSLLSGFLLAGIPGALLFGILNTMAWMVIKGPEKRITISGSVVRFVVFALCGYLLMMVSGLVGAGKRVHEKVSDLKKELKAKGYRPQWVIISQKRYDFYNDFLKNSVKNGRSKHLTGKAIDLFIFDIDGNGTYNRQDYTLMKNASIKCEQSNPHTIGKTYHYFGKGRLTQHMVHIEVE